MSTFYPAKNSGQVNDVKCYTLAEVKAAEPNAAKIIKVDGGWISFDSLTEYEIWRKQK